ncbi:MAG: hypothetical protein GY765_25810 [bacterium]|nr:hypothetical protein [bacterium]
MEKILEALAKLLEAVTFEWFEVGFVLAIALTLLNIHLHNIRRARKLKEFASSIGFTYDMMQSCNLIKQLTNNLSKKFQPVQSSMSGKSKQAEPTKVLPGKGLENLKYFQKRQAPEIRHLISGRQDGISYMIFDYFYIVGGGKGSSRYWQTIAYAELTGLPPFTLRRKNVFHKTGELLGFKLGKIDTIPGFPGAYLLRGGDETRISQCFSPYLLRYLEEKNIHYRFEGGDCGLIMYSPKKREKEKNFNAFFQQFREIAVMFNRNRC